MLEQYVCLLLAFLAIPPVTGSSYKCADGDKECVTMSTEKRLIKHLLQKYEKAGIVGRPVYNTSDTMRVEYGLALIQILDLDEKNQVLTTNCWSRYLWNDILLEWNPDEYDGVKQVRVPTDKIWNPDIVLYNYADDRLKERREALAVVGHTGEVLWIPQAIYKSSCEIDITYFPFDIQKCKMKFGSWTYDGFKLDIVFFAGKDELDLNDYVESNEWVILENPAVRNVKRYPCCEEPYPDLTFYVKFQRKVAFYNYILVLPCVLLSTLTLVLFWLPPESPAKMQLGMNIFVAFFLLLLLLADLTPPAASSVPLIGMNIFVAFFVLLLLLADSTPPAAASIPLIGAYFCLNMILITLSTFLSTIVINLYFRGDKRRRAPRWLKRIMLDGFAKLMCMRDEVSHVDDPQAPKLEGVRTLKDKEKKKYKIQEMKYNKFQMCECGINNKHSNANNHVDLTSPDKSPLNIPAANMETDIKDIRKCVRQYMSRITDKDTKNRKAEEWRVIALVLDRLFFFLYLIAIIISICTIFPRST